MVFKQYFFVSVNRYLCTVGFVKKKKREKNVRLLCCSWADDDVFCVVYWHCSGRVCHDFCGNGS